MLLLWALACTPIAAGCDDRGAQRAGRAPGVETTGVETTGVETTGVERAEAGESTPPTVERRVEEPPKRIILMIGDGMGVPAITAAGYRAGHRLSMLGMSEISLMHTHEYEFLTTDSAASATAIATGRKSHYNAISVAPGTSRSEDTDPSTHMKTLVERAEEAGWRTGVVATSRITHATPAAFVAHESYRRDYEEIARDMAASELDVMLGAGSDFFDGTAYGTDLFAGMRERGWTVATDAESVRRAAKRVTRLAGLVHPKDMPAAREDARAMELPELVETAIEVLDRGNERGFFLMVEGSRIDWSAHAMDAQGVVAETRDFDRAVASALRYARGRDDTLVVVTADHETGGLAVFDGTYASRYERAIGGPEAAAERVEPPETMRRPRPPAPPVQRLEPPEDPSFGPECGAKAAGEVDSLRCQIATTFGYVTMASRATAPREEFWAMHTATMVPLFAEGPGARTVAQVRDNSDLGARLHGLVEASRRKKKVERSEIRFAARRPRNVILMVGDGMGLAPVSAASYLAGGLAMEDLPVRGLVATHALDRLVTDSAAAASALATGYRTRRRALGVRYDDRGARHPARSVLELAEARSMRTGLVTTTSLAHATPAAFYAHVADRSQTARIVEDFIGLADRLEGADGVDVAIGGGRSDFGDEQLARLRAAGVTLSDDLAESPPAAGRRTMHLLADGALAAASARRGEEGAGPGLAEMTRAALDALDDDPQGYFLMVEGGQIDWRLHEMRRDRSPLDEIIDFDEAVAVAREHAASRGDTLVIVVADHDHSMSVLDNHYGFSKGDCGVAKRCGGEEELTALELPASSRIAHVEGFGDEEVRGDQPAPLMFLQYGWLARVASRADGSLRGMHTAHFVPLFAYGPGASALQGFRDIADIGRWLQVWARTE